MMKKAFHYVVGLLIEQQIIDPVNGCEITRTVEKVFQRGSLKLAMMIGPVLILIQYRRNSSITSVRISLASHQETTAIFDVQIFHARVELWLECLLFRANIELRQ
jgi:hypothetical protein